MRSILVCEENGYIDTSQAFQDLSIYDYDQILRLTWKLIKKKLSPENVELIEKYEITMIRKQLAKATHLKNLERLLSLSRKLGKNWTGTKNE